MPSPAARRQTPRTAPLRRFVLVALTCIIAVWSVAQIGAVRMLVEQSVRQFEHQDGITGARRLDGFLRGELERLQQIARDWGYWNDTRDFVLGSKPDYAEDNLDEATFQNLAIDMLVLVTPDRRIVYRWRSNEGPAANAAASTAFIESFLAGPRIRTLLGEGTEVSGIVPSRRGLMLVAAVPILDNERSIRPAGVMLFGRDIDHELLAEGTEHSVFEAELFLPGEADWPSDIVRLWATRANVPTLSAAPVDDEHLGAYALLRNVADEPVGILRSLTPRDTKQRFEAIGRYLLAISLLLAALLALAVVMFLERRVLAPLAAISRVVSTVARDGDLAQRVPTPDRSDELAELGRQINLMLGEIANQQHLREARDNALAASAQKSEFLANMSHEIRTPMNGVLGMLELVLETELTQQQQERVQTAYRSAEGLLALLNDILDFSKLEAGKLELEAREFDLRELAESVVTLFAPNCEHKGIAISCFVAPGPGRYLGDPLRVQQILSNLLGNAVKFTAHGEVSLSVSTGARPEEVNIVVADTGIGIAQERLAQLFQPFTQVDSSMARRYGGTGLGLAICRQLVERMQGRIEVASVSGQGTRFACTLRLQPQPAAVAAPPPYAGRRAVVYGPHDGTRAALLAYLEALGFAAIHFAPGSAADVHPGALLADVDLFVYDDTLPDGGLNGWRSAALAGGAAVLRLTNFNRSAGGGPGGSREQAISKPVLLHKLQRAVDAAVHPHAQVNPLPARPLPQLRNLGGKRVLLVEDNVVNQALALGMLETYDVIVDCAESGREALERLENEAYDLVLMDCQMPEMDGLEATRHWRRREAERGGPRVPIVALTANAMAGDRESCLASGMDGYLAKPFTRAALTEQLREWLAVGAAAASARPRSVDVV